MAECDVLVVGAGPAGLMCALESAQHGLAVTVIESAPEIGGTFRVAAGHMSAAGTRQQRLAGIDDHPDSHFADIMEIGYGRADPALVRLAVDTAPVFVDWLDEHGFIFADSTPADPPGHSPYSKPRMHWGVNRGYSILDVLMPQLAQHVAAGRIRFRLSAPMRALVVEGGVVRGIGIGDGGDTQLRAGVTVLATGGYGSNPELFAELTPRSSRLVTSAIPMALGDGLRFAAQHGAQVRFGDLHTPRLGLLERRASPGRASFESGSLDLKSRPGRTAAVWVNAEGRRFVAEDSLDVAAQEHAIMEQPGSQFWVVFDKNGRDESPVAHMWDVDRLHQECAEGDVAWMADDISTLGSRTGIDPVGLEQTVLQVGSDKGASDDRFGRDQAFPSLATPPFYAVRSPATVLSSFGGLAIDTSFNVIRDDNSPIDGLKAIGEIIGMGATSGAAFCGGMALTPALSFGQELGKRLGRS